MPSWLSGALLGSMSKITMAAIQRQARAEEDLLIISMATGASKEQILGHLETLPISLHMLRLEVLADHPAHSCLYEREEKRNHDPLDRP